MYRSRQLSALLDRVGCFPSHYIDLTYNSVGTSSPSHSHGMRRASGPNPFTRGPSSGGVTLSCHDMGECLVCCLVLLYAIMMVFAVPIYDARRYGKSFYELVPEIDQLDRINRELPSGSCAVVAYTVNTWGSSTPINVSFNIKWVALLGVPPK